MRLSALVILALVSLSSCVQGRKRAAGHSHLDNMVKDCHRHGERFLRRYIEYMVGDRKTFKTCQFFSQFNKCLTKLEKRFPGASHHNFNDHWQALKVTFQKYCIDKIPVVANWLTCYEDEYGSLMARRCDSYFRFNIRQNTRQKCHFIKESIWCKDALVTSSCGRVAGEFSHHLAKLDMHKHLVREKCTVYRHANYPGFKYTTSCPTTISDKIFDCEDRAFRERRLKFHNENDLIALGNIKDIRQTCRVNKRFKKCLGPIKKACPKGADMVYEFEGSFRIYLMKVDYICQHNVKDAYIKHLACYQTIMANQDLKVCDPHWANVKPWLSNVTSYQFYCQVHSPGSKRLQAALDTLRQCYVQIFNRNCSHHAGAIIDTMMQQAFKDPYYLRYRYRPNCTLHSGIPYVPVTEEITTTASTVPTTVSTSVTVTSTLLPTTTSTKRQSSTKAFVDKTTYKIKTKNKDSLTNGVSKEGSRRTIPKQVQNEPMLRARIGSSAQRSRHSRTLLWIIFVLSWTSPLVYR